jgi:hypothetical protein
MSMKLKAVLTHPKHYYFGLVLIMVGMPLSMFLMSLGSIWVATLWVIEGDHRRKLKAFWDNKAAVAFSSLFVLHLVGLIYTSDFEYAFKDLLIKLPILVMPLIYCGMPKFSKKQIKQLLFIFVAACFLQSLGSYGKLFGVWYQDAIIKDGRDIVLFVSHIRLSLFLALAVFILGYYGTRDALKWKLLYAALIGWFLVYMWVIESPTGFTVLLCGTIIILIYSIWKYKSLLLRATSLLLLLGLPIGSYIYVKQCVDQYYTLHDDMNELETYSAGGEEYRHWITNFQLENGHYVYIYIAPKELHRGWNRISSIHIDSLDLAGQHIDGTLIRYMTSKGLRKDSIGINALTPDDISNVEKGVASINYNRRHGIRKRIDQIIFEFDIWQNSGNASGSSVTQKFEIWHTASLILQKHWMFGVGTGDVGQAFQDQYIAMNSPLEENRRLRGHNQYLTIFLTFGIFGILWFLIALFYPLFKLRVQFDFLYTMFFVSVLLSFLSEDTLETQAGLTYFVTFSCLLLFAREGIPIERD